MINLPNLKAYKTTFLNQGITYPLPIVPFNKPGLLHQLPAPPADKHGWPWTDQVDTALYDKNLQWPKITIVTPSYNQGIFIEQTIRAVLLQNYPNLEYIIMDGSSTDETVAIIEKYKPWLSYQQSKKDKGQGNAINQGFSLASGVYYAWINSDDYYLKNTFLKVIDRFRHIKSGFIYGYALDFDHSTQLFRKLNPVLPFLDYFIRIPSLAQPSCFWSADIHQPIWEELHCSLDYELWLRMVKGNRRSLIKDPLSVATVHPDAKTSDPAMKIRWQRDHELICDTGAHGAVMDWNQRFFLNRVRIKLYQWLKLI
ncbi:glycosyltransferase family 2 protein [Mucilaginibacter dorajii]|uniref:Glycosyltransferase family 2 protein n=1 Tax=Mucilaginibacter dorajii TaxID=692994 RepID=A0ABP7Q2E2_9SPHI|nr:glycosyltransferase family 2 protein [Mucilaginibacter dorajii]MCS3732764.1 glycosyltransferase involved in cell wall biosynthesis [Mucilaginibacter dorajii]